MSQSLTIVLFVVVTLVLVGGVVAGVLRLQDWVQSATAKAVREACASWGLKPVAGGTAPSNDPVGLPFGGVHEGLVDGIEVSVGPSWLVGTAYAGLAYQVARVVVAARLPRPLGFDMRLSRSGHMSAAPAVAPPAPVVPLGDQPFDRRVKVMSKDAAAVRKFLGSASLRRKLVRFVGSGPSGSVVVSATGVVRAIYNAHLAGSPAVSTAVRAVVSLAKAMLRRDQLVRGESEPTLLESTEELILDQLHRLLPGFEDFRLRDPRPVQAGIELRDAYGVVGPYSPEDFLRLKTPRGFPRLAPDQRTPPGLLRVDVECDDGQFKDTRNTWYGFSGYWLELLFVPELGRIWDARWQKADD